MTEGRGLPFRSHPRGCGKYLSRGWNLILCAPSPSVLMQLPRLRLTWAWSTASKIPMGLASLGESLLAVLSHLHLWVTVSAQDGRSPWPWALRSSNLRLQRALMFSASQSREMLWLGLCGLQAFAGAVPTGGNIMLFQLLPQWVKSPGPFWPPQWG